MSEAAGGAVLTGAVAEGPTAPVLRPKLSELGREPYIPSHGKGRLYPAQKGDRIRTGKPWGPREQMRRAATRAVVKLIPELERALKAEGCTPEQIARGIEVLAKVSITGLPTPKPAAGSEGMTVNYQLNVTKI